jgi:hypothetical protein
VPIRFASKKQSSDLCFAGHDFFTERRDKEALLLVLPNLDQTLRFGRQKVLELFVIDF